MKTSSFALLGTFIDSENPQTLRVRSGCAVCENGVCAGIFDTLPEKYAHLPVLDYSGRLILPGMTDLHLHAPQYAYCGTAMDLELLEWLNTYTFPEESRFADAKYAEKAYDIFTDALRESATTRACIFASIHTDATLLLMEKLSAAGLSAYVGKVGMDRNSPDNYREENACAAANETERWLKRCEARRDALVRPMITPRFTPSCTDEYMNYLGYLAQQYGVPAQSHLNENHAEIEWVRALCPDAKNYADTYARYGLFGGAVPTVMAHCIYNTPEEDALAKQNGVMIAHCPTSNENVIAGITPAARYLREGYRIGIGSDVAGGHTLNLLAVMAAAVQVSKLRFHYLDDTQKPLSMAEAFYMATAGGGAFFGKVGKFEPGYAFDACVFNDSCLKSTRSFTPQERLERLAYLHDGKPAAKFVAGRQIL